MRLLLCVLLPLLSLLAQTAEAGSGPTAKELDEAFLKGIGLRNAGKNAEAIPFFEKAAALAGRPESKPTGDIKGRASEFPLPRHAQHHFQAVSDGP